VLPGQHGDGAEVEVELVTGDDLADRGLVPFARREQRRQLAEVVLDKRPRHDARSLLSACLNDAVEADPRAACS
jgi:hypothetical protein